MRTPQPSPAQAKFQELLRELFQFDCADLDFGIYRIMNHKRKVLDEYIDRDLPGAIENAVRQGTLGRGAERARTFREAAAKTKKVLGAAAIGPDGELDEQYRETPIGKKYMVSRERALHSDPSDVVRQDIYNHLYAFFSRYYQDGDFAPRHRYSHDHPYVVPYSGEEVHFHWANRDQYYVKSAEQLRDYKYLTPSGVSVRFFLRSANIEHNDVRGSKRFFFPLLDQAVWEDERRALHLPFEYRPLTCTEARELGTKRQQDTIIERATTSVSEGLPTLSQEAAKALLDRRQARTGEEERMPVLFAHHARRFSRRRTSDFFVHRDLGGFLNRELRFYLTSEVVNLESMSAAGEKAARAWLDKVRIIREVGANIIDFLAQIEGFQKMLWEKRKFVVGVHYCVAVRLIPDALLPPLLDCEEQWREWCDLGCADPGGLFPYGEKHEGRLDFLRRNPGALIDTRHFDSPFVDELLGTLDGIDEETDGLVIKSENWQALNLLLERYAGSLSCIYIDPPYNTGDSEILYKNGYLMSSWLSLMADRLLLARRLLKDDSAFFIAIDDFELRDLCALVDTVLPECRRDIIVVNHHPQGGKAKTLSTTHEYMVTCTKGARVLRGRDSDLSVEKRPFKRSGTAESNFRRGRPNSFYAVLVDPESRCVVGIESPPDGDEYPVGPTHEGYVRVYPLGRDGSERVWRRAYESCLSLLEDDSLVASKNMVIYHLIESDERAVFSNWIDKRHNASVWGANLLTDLMGDRHAFSYPKSVHTVADAVESVACDGQDVILDYFAGSGTTGHAVIDLNRKDGGRRKFILAEMGAHFDTVLMPRLKKIAFSPKWKNGTAEREAKRKESQRGPRIIKYFAMECYEDTLGNIEFESPANSLFGLEDYVLRYMLQWETKGSATLLDVERLDRPFDYKLHLNGDGHGGAVAVDLPETFNHLLGLVVDTRRVYENHGHRYLVYTGRTQDGRKAAVIWRNTDGWTLDERELDRTFVEGAGFAADADEIWMNSDSMVKGARSLDSLFKQRMFGFTAD